MPKLAKGAVPKSALVTIRLTPRMRYGLDLMTRIHQRSITESVKFAIENLFATPVVGLLLDARGNDEHAQDLLKLTWREEEWQRFVMVAAYYPEALTKEEVMAWQAICDNRKYWKDRTPRTKLVEKLPPHQLLGGLDDKQLEADWPRLKGRIGTF